jgi:hypothetical protein
MKPISVQLQSSKESSGSATTKVSGFRFGKTLQKATMTMAIAQSNAGGQEGPGKQ